MTRTGADGVFILADPNAFLHRKRLADLAVKSRLPSMHLLTELVEAGEGDTSIEQIGRTVLFSSGTMPRAI
jgi:hypothetical protein